MWPTGCDIALVGDLQLEQNCCMAQLLSLQLTGPQTRTFGLPVPEKEARIWTRRLPYVRVILCAHRYASLCRAIGVAAKQWS